MSAASTYLANALLSQIFKGVTGPVPSALYVGLHVGAPGAAGTGGTEVSGGAYARQALTTSTWNAPSSGALSNAVPIAFPTATGAWNTVTHVTLWDAVAAGNLIAWAPLAEAKTISSGDVLKLPVGAVGIALT